MEERKARELLVACGKELLERGLVARTWGNISCRLDQNHMLITPSGLDYTTMQPEDIALMDLTTLQWQGPHKPSSEKGVHVAAYQTYPNVEFVIHTHQEYATALGLAGADDMDISLEEEAKLGGIAVAEYGLSGTGKLTKAVRKKFMTGAEVIFMVHHGVVIAGGSKEETIEKAVLLDQICRRNCKAVERSDKAAKQQDAEALLKEVKKNYPVCQLLQTPMLLTAAKEQRPVLAQVDDMAQMIGRSIPVVNGKTAEVLAALGKADAVLIRGYGAIVKAENQDDCEAMGLLVQKAALCHLHTAALHKEKKCRLGFLDVALQHFVYVKKYAKQKK